jgi:ankyrin repeat protein
MSNPNVLPRMSYRPQTFTLCKHGWLAFLSKNQKSNFGKIKFWNQFCVSQFLFLPYPNPNPNSRTVSRVTSHFYSIMGSTMSLIPSGNELTDDTYKGLSDIRPCDAEFFEIMETKNESWLARLQIFKKEAPDINAGATRAHPHPYFNTLPRTIIHELAEDTNGDVEMNIQKMVELVNLFGTEILNRSLRLYDEERARAHLPTLPDEGSEGDDDYFSNEHPKRITALYVAVDKKNSKMVKALIRSGAALDICCDYCTPSELFFAVNNNDVEMALLLLACGASPHVADSCNHYTLLKVVQNRQIAEALITMGANVNVRSSVGWTNLHTTPVRDSLEVLETLVANGANPRARDGDAKTTPRNSAFISDDSKMFLSLAEKYIKLYNIMKNESAFANISPNLNVTDRDRVLTLANILDPLVLTTEKKDRIREDLFARSIIYDDESLKLTHQATITFLLCAQDKARQGKTRRQDQALSTLPFAILKCIADYIVVHPTTAGRGDAMMFDYAEDDWDCDWGIPSDADTENDFGGHNDFDFEGY